MKHCQKILNKYLMDAVTSYNVKTVKESLEKGADPNYSTYSKTDKEDMHQPTTPLKMVMFRISDCMLEDEELRKFSEIAKLLIQYGAETGPAMIIAEVRYGKYDPIMESNPFSDVWHLVAKGHKGVN